MCEVGTYVSIDGGFSVLLLNPFSSSSRRTDFLQLEASVEAGGTKGQQGVLYRRCFPLGSARASGLSSAARLAAIIARKWWHAPSAVECVRSWPRSRDR